MPQEFLKHAVPGALHVISSGALPRRFANKKMTAASTTIAMGMNELKLHLFFFLVRLAKNVFLVCVL